MPINVINFVLLRHVLFYGYLSVSNLVAFELACSKILRELFWNKIMNSNQLGVRYTKLLKFNFSNVATRTEAECLDDWFVNHKAFKMENVQIEKFNDASCILGVDMLNHQKLVKLSVLDSFTIVPCEIACLVPFILTSAITLQELIFYKVGTITTEQLCNLSGLVSLKTLCIIYCYSVDFEGLFSLLNECTSLEMYQFQTIRECKLHDNKKDYAERQKKFGKDLMTSCFTQLMDAILLNRNLCVVRLCVDCQLKCDIVRLLKEFACGTRKIAFKRSIKYSQDKFIHDPAAAFDPEVCLNDFNC